MTPAEPVVYISPFLSELAHTYGEPPTAEAGPRRVPKNSLSSGADRARMGPMAGSIDAMREAPGARARSERAH